MSKKTGTFTKVEIYTSKDEPTVIRLHTRADRPFNTPAAVEWFLEQIEGPNGIADIDEITVCDNQRDHNGGGCVLLQLTPAIRTKRQAQGVARSFTTLVDASVDELDHKQLSSFRRQPLVDEQVIKNCSAYSASGSMDDSFDRILH